MPPANSFPFDKSSARSFMSFRNRTGPNEEPLGTHAVTWANEEACPLSTTFCALIIKKLYINFKVFWYEDNAIVPHFINYFKNCDTFNDLRYILYTKKNKTLRSLPPTSNLSHGHTLRSHYVVFICSNLIPAPDTNLNPIGWNSVDSVLIPINVSLNYHICTLLFVATRRKCTRYQCSKFGASCTVSCKCNEEECCT